LQPKVVMLNFFGFFSIRIVNKFTFQGIISAEYFNIEYRTRNVEL